VSSRKGTTFGKLVLYNLLKRGGGGRVNGGGWGGKKSNGMGFWP